MEEVTHVQQSLLSSSSSSVTIETDLWNVNKITSIKKTLGE